MPFLYQTFYNFRNLKNDTIDLSSREVYFVGENGQGKTNLIESIWMMTGFYSFRARKNIQLIKKDRDEARIETKFISHGREQNAELKINLKKELILNGVKEESPRALMGSFYAVVFSPVTLGIVQDGPSERRKLLDVALSLMKPNYALIMSKYIRALNQRNNLFKKLGEKSRENRFYFEPWKNIFEAAEREKEMYLPPPPPPQIIYVPVAVPVQTNQNYMPNQQNQNNTYKSQNESYLSDSFSTKRRKQSDGCCCLII